MRNEDVTGKELTSKKNKNKNYKKFSFYDSNRSIISVVLDNETLPSLLLHEELHMAHIECALIDAELFGD